MEKDLGLVMEMEMELAAAQSTSAVPDLAPQNLKYGGWRC
jgi:hypothetical protein